MLILNDENSSLQQMRFTSDNVVMWEVGELKYVNRKTYKMLKDSANMRQAGHKTRSLSKQQKGIAQSIRAYSWDKRVVLDLMK